ncbi:DUF5682 family protein [Nonomuraea typhae]|uniref:DUF5682 family protein n=1 Tax=Nonomuraea typhae TaxID=2603600 RepID=UPI0012FA2713|nr:DUF5682 family protein [Nonomuraea typhae]
MIEVFGIRHHGPGSARALQSALDRLRPDVILIEGPPEADALIAFAPHCEPPVALLAHVPGDPARSAFWPFAVFSPEWQAIRYGTRHGIPIRFCDLPAVHLLAAEAGAAGHTRDPIGELAAAAGHDDPERWWEDAVEHRGGGAAGEGTSPFAAIAEAMSALREGHEPDEFEARREASMRKVLRAAVKSGHERIAVVCGAWHVPALAGPLPPAKADDRLLRGLPKVKAELAWVPWTYGRLAARSGYGAGVASPGWYHHLFTAPDRPVERWLAAAGSVLREEGLAVSAAHVIEAVRLAETLATLRGRPLPGLGEVTEAARAVLCDGDEPRVGLIQRRMVVGHRLGHVGDGAPLVPLQRDLRAEQRRLRLRPGQSTDLDLDLRKPLDLARSRLLHRLRLLGVPWGVPGQARGKGTFREVWRLEWRPEFDLTLIEAAALGTTVESAATRHILDRAGVPPGDHGTGPEEDRGTGPEEDHVAGPAEDRGTGPEVDRGAGPAEGPNAGAGGDWGARDSGGGLMGPGGRVAPTLAELASLVEGCLLAGLPGALPGVLAALSDRAALDTDVTHLMAAFPAMVRAHRYGDVRGTPAHGAAAVARSMLERIRAGLGVAVAGLGGEAAAGMLAHVDGVHTAVDLMDDAAARRRWLETLVAVCDGAHGLVAGRLTRMLLDAGVLDDADRRLAAATSRGDGPVRAAAWIEGFLGGGGLLLVHDPRLLSLVDGWLSGLPGEQFTEVLPLLRRTFGGFAVPERRAIGERVRWAAGGRAERELDPRRAEAAERTVLTILGRARGERHRPDDGRGGRG